SFLLPSDVRTADLPDVAGAGIEVETRDQELWATYTVSDGDVAERAHHAVAALMGWAAERGTVLQHLQVRGASLEDVFLQVADGAADLLAE
ncbi:MAG: ABC transporter ATP-binding protein, partial [Nocardiopsis sp. BM-2018]